MQNSIYCKKEVGFVANRRESLAGKKLLYLGTRIISKGLVITEKCTGQAHVKTKQYGRKRPLGTREYMGTCQTLSSAYLAISHELDRLQMNCESLCLPFVRHVNFDILASKDQATSNKEKVKIFACARTIVVRGLWEHPALGASRPRVSQSLKDCLETSQQFFGYERARERNPQRFPNKARLAHAHKVFGMINDRNGGFVRRCKARYDSGTRKLAPLNQDAKDRIK